jgi:hypothetical protein
MAHKRIDYAGSNNPIYFGGEWQPSPTDKKHYAKMDIMFKDSDLLKQVEKLSQPEFELWLSQQADSFDCITPVVGGAGIGSALPRRGRPRKEASNEMD